MVQRAHDCGEVERSVLERKVRDVALDERHVRKLLLCPRPALGQDFWHHVDGDDLLDERRDGERKAARPRPRPARSPPEGSKSPEPARAAPRGGSPRARPCAPPTRLRPACRLSVLLVGQAPAPPLCRDSASRPLFGDQLEQPADLGAWQQAELVTAKQRRCGIGGAGLLDRLAKLGEPYEGERVEGPRLGRAPEAMDRTR